MPSGSSERALRDFGCVAAAWRSHEAELLRFLRHRLGDHHAAEDVLQDVFLKAMHAGRGFCILGNPRAWLFQVARTTLVDHHRANRDGEPLPDGVEELATADVDADPLEELADCLEKVLQVLSADDVDIIRACDLNGQKQQAYATARRLTLPAVKARLQRARRRLRSQLTNACGVRFDFDGRVAGHQGGISSNRPKTTD